MAKLKKCPWCGKGPPKESTVKNEYGNVKKTIEKSLVPLLYGKITELDRPGVPWQTRYDQ